MYHLHREHARLWSSNLQNPSRGTRPNNTTLGVLPMLSRTSTLTKFLFLSAVFLLGSHLSFGQALNSATATVNLTASLGETLTVAATPGTVNFALVNNGIAPGSAPVVITTSWVLGVGRANVVLDAYFASTAAALTTGGATPANIPTSAVLGEDLLGTPTTFTPFTGTGVVGTAGAGLEIFTQPLTALNRAAVRVDNLLLEINTTGLVLPAASYTGTLTLQAQAL
jgi:hypothetical protein